MSNPSCIRCPADAATPQGRLPLCEQHLGKFGRLLAELEARLSSASAAVAALREAGPTNHATGDLTRALMSAGETLGHLRKLLR